MPSRTVDDAEDPPDVDGDFDDEIIAGACITRDGEIVNAGAKALAEGKK